MFIGAMSILGFFATGYIPLCISFAAELTFPLQPALLNGSMTLIGSGFAFCLSLLGAFVNQPGSLDHELSADEQLEIRRWRSKSVIAILLICALIAFVLSLFIKEDLRRLKHQERETEKTE